MRNYQKRVFVITVGIVFNIITARASVPIPDMVLYGRLFDIDGKRITKANSDDTVSITVKLNDATGENEPVIAEADLISSADSNVGEIYFLRIPRTKISDERKVGVAQPDDILHIYVNGFEADKTQDDNFRVSGTNLEQFLDIRNIDLNLPISIDNLNPIALSIADATTQNEGNTGLINFEFVVSLSKAGDSDIRVDFTTVFGTAEDETEDNDFIAKTGTLTFEAGQTLTQTVTVAVNSDSKVEQDEQFTVVLSNPLLGGLASPDLAISDNEGLATIINDDVAEIRVNSAEDGEEDEKDGLFTLTTTNVIDRDVQVNFTSSGAASSGEDYVTLPEFAIIKANQSSSSISVDVMPDILVEGAETVSVELVSTDHEDVRLLQNTGKEATLQIIDDDTAVISFVSENSETLESKGTHTVEVILNVSNNGTLDRDVSISVAAGGSGSADSSSDYSFSSQDVLFPKGSEHGSTESVVIGIEDDNEDEDNEVVNLILDETSLSDGTNGQVIVNTPDSHKILITDYFILSLQKGWNLISFPFSPEETIGELFDGVPVSPFWEWISQEQSSFFSKKANDQSIERLKGYFIYAKNDAKMPFPAAPRIGEAASIKLKEDWTLLGPAANIVIPYKDGIRIIWYLEGTVFKPLPPTGGELEPGKAYWINASEDDTELNLGSLVANESRQQKAKSDEFQIEFQTLAAGFYSGYGEAAFLSIDKEDQFSNYWSRHTGDILPSPDFPTIDFTKEMVIAIISDVENTGGYSIGIDSIEETAREVLVRATKVSPGPTCIVTLALTQPYHIITIPRINKPVRLSLNHKVQNCSMLP